MTDIVERLRAHHLTGCHNDRVAVEAADEIERLRALGPEDDWEERGAAAERQAQDDRALRHAQRLATILWEQHWKSDNPHWKVGDNLLLVIDQIDNAVAKLEKPCARHTSKSE